LRLYGWRRISMCEIIQSLAKDETKRQLRSPNPLEDKRGAPGRALRPFRCRPRSALLKGHSHAMSDRKSIVGDPEIIRARAMETLFERLESLCEGAIAIDRAGHVVYVNENTFTRSASTTSRKRSGVRSRRSSPTA
jgi:hypothetical protein